MTATTAPTNRPSATVAPSRRNWGVFSLRTAVAAMLALSIGLAVATEGVRRQRAAVAGLRSMDVAVHYNVSVEQTASGAKLYRAGDEAMFSSYPDWLVNMLGEDTLFRATEVDLHVEQPTKALPHLKQLPHLQTVRFLDLSLTLNSDLRRRLQRELPGVTIVDSAAMFM